MFEKKALQPTVSQSLGHCWMPNLCPEKVDPIVLHDFGRFSHQFHWLKHGKNHEQSIQGSVCLTVFFLKNTFSLGKHAFFSKKTDFGKTNIFFKNTIAFIEKNTFLVKLYGIEV